MSLEFSINNGVARLTINRPERMNAVDTRTADLMERAWQDIEADSSIRCVVLTGVGDRAFSAGADLKSDGGLTGLEYWAQQNPNGFGGISLRKSLKVPVIARVNGLALGGGMEMVLGCDMVIASAEARFGLTEARVGRVPLDGGMVLLQRLIPEKIAAGLMLTGRFMSSAEAAQYGLVNSVVAAASLDDEVDAWVESVCACAPLSLRAIKDSIRHTAHLSVHDAQGLRAPSLIAALQSEDANEGVAAFREKRSPQWMGR